MLDIFELIDKRPATIKQAPNGRPWIKSHGQRLNLASRCSYTSLNEGRTYWIKGDKVKALKVYI
jgi:hypothetical protein